jgi:hemin uptake protein HemP
MTSAPRSAPPVAIDPSGMVATDPLAEPLSNAERQVKSEDILRGAKAVTIQHQGSVYRLQATKQGKLILTK